MWERHTLFAMVGLYFLIEMYMMWILVCVIEYGSL
jgi:hypothetical protein